MLVLLALATACGSDNGSVPQAEIDLNKTQVSLEVTDRDTLRVISETTGTIEWESNNPEVVMVDEEGRLLALNSGSAEVTATVDGVEASCQVTVDLTIFLAGNSLEFEAAYWKNGEIVYLTTDGNDIGYYSWISSIKVGDGSIYVGGQKHERKATLWKNNDEIPLTFNNPINSMAMFDGEAYAVGGGPWLWKEDGQVTRYDYHNSSTSLRTVFIDDLGDVYMGGYIRDNSTNRFVTTVWKNGTPLSLEGSTTTAFVTDLYVVNGDFHACGLVYNTADRTYTLKYWKNDDPAVEIATISRYSTPSILVNNGDVYIGSQLNQRPTVWVNGIARFYEDNGVYGSVENMVLHGDDVYAVGNMETSDEREVGVVWKNGEEVFRTDLFEYANLTDIDVK